MITLTGDNFSATLQIRVNNIAARPTRKTRTEGKTYRVMAKAASTTIVNVGYRLTNYWVVSAGTSRLQPALGAGLLHHIAGKESK